MDTLHKSFLWHLVKCTVDGTTVESVMIRSKMWIQTWVLYSEINSTFRGCDGTCHCSILKMMSEVWHAGLNSDHPPNPLHVCLTPWSSSKMNCKLYMNNYSQLVKPPLWASGWCIAPVQFKYSALDLNGSLWALCWPFACRWISSISEWMGRDRLHNTQQQEGLERQWIEMSLSVDTKELLIEPEEN